MDAHTIDLDIGIVSTDCRIYLDGIELKRVRRIQIDAEVGSATTVILELFANVRATGTAIVTKENEDGQDC